MKQEHKEKAFKARNDKNSYFSTFKNALVDIRDELIRSKLSGSKILDEAINRINESDKRFLDALSTSLHKL